MTAIELMPVHQLIHDARLVEAGLRNYWGYNSIGFFAPHDRCRARASARCRSSSRWSAPCIGRASK